MSLYYDAERELQELLVTYPVPAITEGLITALLYELCQKVENKLKELETESDYLRQRVTHIKEGVI